MSRVSFEALGGELGKYLSHAFNKVSLQNGNQGDGEVFVIEEQSNGLIALACIGGESGKYLSICYWMHSRKKINFSLK